MAAPACCAGWTLDGSTQTARCGARQVALTPTECKLFTVLAAAHGEPLTRRQLLWEVWGIAQPIETRTVDAYIVRLRRKLGLQHTLRTVYGKGYLLADGLAAAI